MTQGVNIICIIHTHKRPVETEQLYACYSIPSYINNDPNFFLFPLLSCIVNDIDSFSRSASTVSAEQHCSRSYCLTNGKIAVSADNYVVATDKSVLISSNPWNCINYRLKYQSITFAQHRGVEIFTEIKREEAKIRFKYFLSSRLKIEHFGKHFCQSNNSSDRRLG